MAGRVHVIGAGIAGLAAALACVRQGKDAVLYEAAPQAGGRCRTVVQADGFVHDNGTHVLLTANRRALALLEAVGARADWIEPEPDGLPVYDAGTGRLSRIGLSPWSWRDAGRRPEGLDLSGVARLVRLSLPFADRPVAAIVGPGPLRDSLVEPFTLAVLNTPVEMASSRRLGAALRRLARPGAARLLVARRGLSADLIDPALASLERSGVSCFTGMRLRAIERDGPAVTGLRFGERRIPVGAADQVVLALPPWELYRLLPQLSEPEAVEPIANVHFRADGPREPRFIGLRGTLAQWALVRSTHISVTISAAGAAVDQEPTALAGRIWREIVPALATLGLGLPAGPMPEARVVKEKRATIRQAAGPRPQPPRRPLSNLALAGDWLGSFPATIESAVTAGEEAIRLLDRPSGLWRGRAGRAPEAHPAP